jgi:hypothetical protein
MVPTKDTMQRIIHLKDYALKLADSRAEAAEHNAQICELEARVKQLSDLMSGSSTWQYTPHLGGSEASHPKDPGGDEALQGP